MINRIENNMPAIAPARGAFSWAAIPVPFSSFIIPPRANPYGDPKSLSSLDHIFAALHGNERKAKLATRPGSYLSTGDNSYLSLEDRVPKQPDYFRIAAQG